MFCWNHNTHWSQDRYKHRGRTREEERRSTLVCVLISEGAILGRSDTQECAFYNASWEKDATNQSGIESCYGEMDKRRHCFSTWKNRSGTIEMVKQGCWLDDVNCYDSECVERKENPDVFFCCCEGNMCNDKFHYSPEMLQTTSNPVRPKPDLLPTLLYSLIPVMAVAVILFISFWMYRHLKLTYPPLLVPSQYSLNKKSICPWGQKNLSYVKYKLTQFWSFFPNLS